MTKSTSAMTRREINIRNAQRSTGPRSELGKQKSRLNAVKHGLTAHTAVLPGEDPEAFHRRLDEWAATLQPEDPVEQFLVEQAATASWKIERADRFETSRAAIVVRDGTTEIQARGRDEAEHLGRWLLRGDNEVVNEVLAGKVLDIMVPGNTIEPGNAIVAAGLDQPRPILGRLEETVEGCTWLMERWSELREPLEQGRPWTLDQFVQAIRLSGRWPRDLSPTIWENDLRARLLQGVDDEARQLLDDDELVEQDLLFEDAVRAAESRVLGAQLVEDLPEDDTAVRVAMLGVVQRATARLAELAAAHATEAEDEEAERMERAAFDASVEGERLRRYQFGCQRSLRGILGSLLKLRRSGGERTTPDRKPQAAGKGDAAREGDAPSVRPEMSVSDSGSGGDAGTIPDCDNRLDGPVSGEPEATASVREVADPAPPDAGGKPIAAANAPAPLQLDAFTMVVASPHARDLVVAAVAAQPTEEADTGFACCAQSFVDTEATDSTIAGPMADDSTIRTPATAMVSRSVDSTGADPIQERPSLPDSGTSPLAEQPCPSNESIALVVAPERSMHLPAMLVHVITIPESLDTPPAGKRKTKPGEMHHACRSVRPADHCDSGKKGSHEWRMQARRAGE